MKKILFLISLMSIMCIKSYALDFSASYQGKTIYYILWNGEATVTSPSDNSYSGTVIIPSSVNYNGKNYPVTEIGFHAFYYCPNLTSVNIPESVTSISDGAFTFCYSLTSVNIPEGVTSIGASAFLDCRSLTSMSIPSTVTSIGHSAFEACDCLTSVNIPEGVTSIRYNTFNNCVGLTSVTIPSTVTSIEHDAFSGCGLTSVNIPEGVTSIDNYVFSYCPSLTSVNIPEGVTSIGSYAFSNCRSLTSVTIPEGVTSIGKYAFQYCDSLTSVTIPSTVTSIGQWAFLGCSSLTSVTINSNAIMSKSYSSNSTIHETIFSCPVKEYIIGEGVTSIGTYAFSGSSSLTSVTIPSSVTSIGNSAFSNCRSLTSVYSYMETPPSIISSTFSNRTNATLYVPYGSKTAYESADYWKEFKEIIEIEPDVPDPTEVTLTIGNAGVATFACPYDLDFSGITDFKAYVASGFKPTTGKLVLTQVDEVPAGTGLYVKGTAGEYTIPVQETDMVFMNFLVGLTEETIVSPTTDGKTNFILANGAHGIGFYTLSQAGPIGAGKAYLSIPTSSVPTAANYVGLVFEDEETTGISEEVIVNSEKSVGEWYTLGGQKLDKKPTQKGVYIMNSKKIVIK